MEVGLLDMVVMNKTLGAGVIPGVDNREFYQCHQSHFNRGKKDASLRVVLPTPEFMRLCEGVRKTFGLECNDTGDLSLKKMRFMSGISV